MNFTRVVTDSGLTKIELAALYGVSRQSIHGWAVGHPPRENSLLARQAEVITQALVLLIDRRQLPWGAMDKTVRASRITKMAERLQSLKPAAVKS
ncbi:MAG: hypothetical protein NUV51_11740 [Sulfuricaulis sp.]|nr:hypothetical protein [Sulfuricaulis sp.]